jgi:hypothetical protein
MAHRNTDLQSRHGEGADDFIVARMTNAILVFWNNVQANLKWP